MPSAQSQCSQYPAGGGLRLENAVEQHRDRLLAGRSQDVHAAQPQTTRLTLGRDSEVLTYADFIEAYANLSEDEWVCYCNEYLPQSERREVIMGLVQRCREEGRQLGRQEGIREGLLAGIELGLELKFGDEGLRLLPEIRAIENTDILRALQQALKTADTPAALRRLYTDR